MNESMISPPPQPKAPKQPKQKKDVMPAVKQDAGVGGRKKPSEIIQDYLMQQSGDPKAAAVYMNALYSLIQRKISRLIQFGNTVFLATQKAPGVIDVHVFTEDSAKTLVKRFQQAYQWAKAHGFKQITSDLTDGSMVQLIKMAGLPMDLKQTQVNDGKQMVPAYHMTMEVR